MTRSDRAREALRAAILELDAALAEEGVIEAHAADEVLTHAVVAASWHQFGDPGGPDATQEAHYYLDPMAGWMASGLLKKVAQNIDADERE